MTNIPRGDPLKPQPGRREPGARSVRGPKLAEDLTVTPAAHTLDGHTGSLTKSRLNSTTLVEEGNGVPTHTAERSTQYQDLDTNKVYINSDGATTWVEIGTGAGSGYATIQDEGSALTQRTTVDFVGAGVTAIDTGAKTQVSIPGGGVTDADYLVGTAHAGLSAEIVVGATPAGELGGTWGSPTVDPGHAAGTYHEFDEMAAPGTPAAAKVRVYAKADGKMYRKDDAGTEAELGGGGGGAVATDVIWDTKGDLAVATGADTAEKLLAAPQGRHLVSAIGTIATLPVDIPLNADTDYGTPVTLFVDIPSSTDAAFSPAVTLAEDLTAAETDADVNDASGIEVGDIIAIDLEEMQVTAIAANTLTLVRAMGGTVARVHSNGATVLHAAATFKVNSVTGISINDVVVVDSEKMKVRLVNTSAGRILLTVVRAVNSTGATHVVASTVKQSGTAFTYTVDAEIGPLEADDKILIDSERMNVTVSDRTNYVVTVTREVDGTSDATHAAAAAISSPLGVKWSQAVGGMTFVSGNIAGLGNAGVTRIGLPAVTPGSLSPWVTLNANMGRDGKMLQVNPTGRTSAAFSTLAGIEIIPQFTAGPGASGSILYALVGQVQLFPTTDILVGLGLIFVAQISDGAGAVTTAAGIDLTVQATGGYSGTVTDLIAARVQTGIDSGTVTNAYCLITRCTTTGGAVTNNYAIYINALPIGTNRYGIYMGAMTGGTIGYLLELGTGPTLRLKDHGTGGWTAAANETPLWLKEGATPTLRQMKTTDMAYLSLYIGEASAVSAAQFDVFDQDNYGGSFTAITNMVTAKNITHTVADGRFTVAVDGVYVIDVTLIMTCSGATTYTVSIQDGGVDFYTGTWQIIGTTADQIPQTVCVIRALSAGDYINVLVDATGVPTIATAIGTAISMYKLADITDDKVATFAN